MHVEQLQTDPPPPASRTFAGETTVLRVQNVHLCKCRGSGTSLEQLPGTLQGASQAYLRSDLY